MLTIADESLVGAKDLEREALVGIMLTTGVGTEVGKVEGKMLGVGAGEGSTKEEPATVGPAGMDGDAFELSEEVLVAVDG